jgi:hypothetical protein
MALKVILSASVNLEYLRPITLSAKAFMLESNVKSYNKISTTWTLASISMINSSLVDLVKEVALLSIFIIRRPISTKTTILAS